MMVQCIDCNTPFSLDDSTICPKCGNPLFQAVTSNSKVFILQKDRYNVISAREYGSVVWMFDKEAPLDPFRIKDTSDAIRMRLEQMEFNPAVDFITLTGPNSLVAIFLAVALTTYKNINVLIFDPAASRYRSRLMEAA